MDIGSVFLIVVGALIIAVIWYLGTRQRAAQAQAYAELAARADRTMTDVLEQLTDLNRRTGELQRILKDAE
jgi:hypothetical protein